MKLTQKQKRKWLDDVPIIQRVSKNVRVVRDDLIEGGSKLRFLPFLCDGADEIVFGGPFCGGAPLALSVLGRETGQKITLFYAGRKELHPRQRHAKRNGAKLVQVYPGYMTNVQAKARTYAQKKGALFLPLGFDVPAATSPFIEAINNVRKRIGGVDEVWCCCGSGMLTRCLAQGFPESEIRAVAVGLASRHSAQDFPSNVTLLGCDYEFAKETKAAAPFPSDPNYDLKAWEVMSCKPSRKTRIFWNVMGPSV